MPNLPHRSLIARALAAVRAKDKEKKSLEESVLKKEATPPVTVESATIKVTETKHPGKGTTARNRAISLSVSREELAILKAHARLQGLTFSSWARDILLAQTNQIGPDLLKKEEKGPELLKNGTPKKET